METDQKVTFEEMDAGLIGRKPDDSLLDTHRHTHGLAKLGDVDCTELKRVHSLVVAEMKRREMNHDSPLECTGAKAGLCLQPPHGFLLWRGKKTAIAEPPNFVEQYGDKAIDMPLVVVSGDEAYGVVILGKPASMTVEEFDRREWTEQHRVRPEERKEWWLGAEMLHVYPIKDWKPYPESRPIVVPQDAQGYVHAVEFKAYRPPTEQEQVLITKGKRLPKTIVLTPNAVSLTGSQIYGQQAAQDTDLVVVGADWREDEEQFVVPLTPTFKEKVERVLKAVFGIDNEVQYIAEGAGATFDYLPLYDLALVRRPRLEVEHVSEAEPDFAALCYDKKATTEGTSGGNVQVKQESEDDPAAAPSASKAASLLDYPDEGKGSRFVFQHHYRGKSVHGDFRVETGDYLVGWTVADQITGAIKESVTTMADAKRENADAGNWKMDLKTGLIKPRKIRGGTVRRGELRAFPKATEIPEAWLDVEGVTEKPEPGEVTPVGATTEFPGVFTIIEKGTVEHGAKKATFQEYFVHGKKWADQRWMFRTLERKEDEKGVSFIDVETGEVLDGWEELFESLEKAAVLPPGQEEEEPRTKTFWVLMQPEDQTPYVLGREAVKKGWLPPKSVSALPKSIRKHVPENLQYWKSSGKAALAKRRELSELDIRELGGPELKEDESMYTYSCKTCEKEFESKVALEQPVCLDCGNVPDEKAGRRLRGDKLGLLTEIRDGFDSLMERLKELISWGGYDDEQPSTLADLFKGDTGFAVKEVEGVSWFFTWTTNAFEDRQKEIFSTQALEHYVSENNEKEDKGTFNLWHINDGAGTNFARKEWQAVIGRFLVEAGPFLDNHQGHSATKFFTQNPEAHSALAPEGWGCSPEYKYLPEERETGIYDWIWIVRTSILPRAAAANIWTKATEVTTMAMTDQQKEMADAIFGKDWVQTNLIQEGDRRTKELEEAGIAHKGETPEPEVKPAAEPETDEKRLDAKFGNALKEIAAEVDDDATKKAILAVASELTEDNAEDQAKTLKMLAGKLKGALKTRLSKIATALAAGEGYPAPGEEISESEEKEQPTRVEIDIEALAEKVAKSFGANLAPMAEAVASLAVDVKAIDERTARLEKETDIKAQTEKPRFVLELTKRASEAEETALKEGDDLLEKKPKETSPRKEGASSIDAYFPR